MKTIQQIDNLTSLKQLLVQTISVNSLDEFQTLINAELGVKWVMIPKVTIMIWQPSGNILIDMNKTVPFERLQFL